MAKERPSSRRLKVSQLVGGGTRALVGFPLCHRWLEEFYQGTDAEPRSQKSNQTQVSLPSLFVQRLPVLLAELKMLLRPHLSLQQGDHFGTREEDFIGRCTDS